MSTSEKSKLVEGGDFALKVAALAIATIAGVIGWVQHQHNLRDERDIKAREVQGNLDLRRDEYDLKKTELNQQFWTRRSDVCMLAAGAGARIAVQHGKDLKAIEDFWILYWGPLAGITGRADSDHISIEETIGRFTDAMNGCLQRPDDECWEQLKACSADIAHECTAMACEGIHEKENVDACNAVTAPRKLLCPPSTRQVTH